MPRKTLAEHLAADPALVFIQDDDFAEDVVYTPFEGAQRSITVTVTDDDTAMEPMDGGTETAVRRLRVFAVNNASTGIDTPAIGDQLLRAGDDDPFVFSGDVFDEDGHCYLLGFWRREDRARG